MVCGLGPSSSASEVAALKGRLAGSSRLTSLTNGSSKPGP